MIASGNKEMIHNDGKLIFWTFLPLYRDYMYFISLRFIPNVKLDLTYPYEANVLLVYGYL